MTQKPNISRTFARWHANFWRAPRLPVAAEVFEAYLRFRSDDGLAWFWFGNALRRVGRLEESVRAYIRARCYRPDDPYVLARLGIVLAELWRHVEAEEHFIIAGCRAPDVIWIWETWAESLFRVGRFLEAREKLEIALRLPNCQASTYVRLGEVLVALREYPQAERAYRQARRLDPGFEDCPKGPIRSVEWGTSLRKLLRFSRSESRCYGPNCRRTLTEF